VEKTDEESETLTEKATDRKRDVEKEE